MDNWNEYVQLNNLWWKLYRDNASRPDSQTEARIKECQRLLSQLTVKL